MCGVEIVFKMLHGVTVTVAGVWGPPTAPWSAGRKHWSCGFDVQACVNAKRILEDTNASAFPVVAVLLSAKLVMSRLTVVGRGRHLPSRGFV
jgi:hypothetical protein